MIDYHLIGEAICYYEGCGYKRVEAPWLVTRSISDLTKPANASSYIVKKDNELTEKVFVASGEQSLLYLINKGFLPVGCYQTVTPCMRNDGFDESHSKYFMKLELIRFSTDSMFDYSDAADMAEEALGFFRIEANDCDKLKTVALGNDTFDIEYDGVEIGSYGVRSSKFCSWVYGTGLAEPRFSRFARGAF